MDLWRWQQISRVEWPRVISWLIFSLLLGWSPPSDAAEGSFRISLNLQVTPTTMQDQLLSCLRRELRSIPDVSLVEDNTEWIMRVLVLETQNKASGPLELIASVVLGKRYEPLWTVEDRVERQLNQKLVAKASLEPWMTDPSLREVLRDIDQSLASERDFFKPVILDGHTLFSDSDLHSLCRRLVASVDTKHLEPLRQQTEEIISKVMQMRLKDAGFDPGPIDGKLGGQTKAALRQFQRQQGLRVTGTLDDDSRKALGLQK